MTTTYPTIDLTKQRIKLSSRLFGGAEECWIDDATADVLARQGILDISFEANEPSNERKLWFKRDVPTGNHGWLMCYDAELDAWVKLTPDRYKTWMSISGRAKWWFTSKLGTAIRPPDTEVILGDYWDHDTGTDNELSIYRISDKAPAWVDITGGELDESIITAKTPKFSTGIGLPSGELTASSKTGDFYRATDTGRVYQFWATVGWQDVSA